MTNPSELLKQIEHRPWSPPPERWLMTQTWERLLFAHWPVDPKVLKQSLPPELSLDVYEGQAWLGVVPFSMSYRLRGVPISIRFHELNVRTYVTQQGRPGVYFFSLDASDWFTVLAARLSYNLPYYGAQIIAKEQDEDRYYRSQRQISNHLFEATYRPVSSPSIAEAGSLAHWLTERYCLYALNRQKQLCCAEVHHAPWPLQAATATIMQNTMVHLPGISLETPPALLHYAHHLDVLVWPLKAC